MMGDPPVTVRDEITDIYYAVAADRGPALARIDVLKAVYGMPKILEQAGLDIAQRYRRSILGPIWLVLGTLALALGFGALGSFIFQVDREFYLLYVLAGIMAWQLMSSCLTDATGVYAGDSSVLLSSRQSIASYAVRVLARQSLIMAHSVPIVLAISAFTERLTLESLLIIPALLLVWLTLLPIVLVVGLWAARMRDVGQLVTVSLQFLVYMTPVFWMEGAVPTDSIFRFLIELNPFYHMVQLIREPLLGDPPAQLHWTGALFTCGVAWLLASVVFPAARGRVVYWL